MLWAAAGLWLVLNALQSQDDAWESGVRIGTEALAVSGVTSQDWSGLLLDSSGRLLLAQPADLLEGVDDADAYAATLWASAGRITQGWLDIDGAQGRFRRVYFSRAGQGRAWVALPPCRRLDPLCSHGPVWMGAAALALLAPLALLAAWLARAVGCGPLPPPARRAACGQRMQAVGWLSGAFAHELNNQLGIISNSAYLVRRIDDARLALPAQAMLRAVASASALTQRLQRYGVRDRAGTQALDLCHWLPCLQPALALVLGKRMALGMGMAPQAMLVQVDPDAFELALSCIMLGVRDVLADGTVVRLTAGFLDEVAEYRSAPGRHVQVCVEAWACWPPVQVVPVGKPPRSAPGGDDCQPLELAEGLLRSVGSEVWLRSEPGRCVVLALVLPVRDGGGSPSV